MPGLVGSWRQQDHGAAAEVKHQAAQLVDGRDAQHRQSRGLTSGFALVLAQGLDPGRGAQGVADEWLAVEPQPPVEEVRAHVLRHHGGLPDRGVPHEGRTRHRAAGHHPGELVVKCQPEPVAHRSGMRRLDAFRQRHGGRRLEDLADSQFVEIRPAHCRGLVLVHASTLPLSDPPTSGRPDACPG